MIDAYIHDEMSACVYNIYIYIYIYIYIIVYMYKYILYMKYTHT